MTQPFYLNIAIDTPLNSVFDYLPINHTNRQQYVPGQRIIASFGRTQKTGILVGVSSSTQLNAKQLKPIKERLDDTPLLSNHDIKLLIWSAKYYHQPIGEVFAQALPKKLRMGALPNESFEKTYFLSPVGKDLTSKQLQRSPRQAALHKLLINQPNAVTEEVFSELEWNWKPPLKSMVERDWVIVGQSSIENSFPSTSVDFTPNAAQQSAVLEVLESLDAFKPFLLEGVTGSGKTEVYLQIIRHVLLLGKQVLVMLPEINLTPQLASRFRQRLATNMVVYHSGLSDTQRAQSWLKCRNGSANILLGTRSSVFTPMDNLGLIILDEEHDTSFKQQEGFRYSARDVATVRAKNLDIPIIMGSATPSLESLYNVEKNRFKHLALPKRAGGAKTPKIKLIDCRNKTLNHQLSAVLTKAISACLERDEQIILFVNRRGFAPALMCHSCGWIAQCRRCDSKLVLHKKLQLLKCHHCNAEHKKPPSCPDCLQDELFPLGAGTQRIEEALHTMYPCVPITRIDRDSTRSKDAMQTAIDKVHQGGPQILVGTQMLAKGHHFPNVTLVGIIDMDAGLFSIDYRANERMAQLLTQVAGRAGRESKPGTVLIQTYHPEHPLLKTLIEQDYSTFARNALIERQQAELPPYHHQALLRVNAVDESSISQFLDEVKSNISTLNNDEVNIYGPVPSPMLKRAGRLRYQMLYQAWHRKPLHQFLQLLITKLNSIKSARKVRWSIDVDPIDLY